MPVVDQELSDNLVTTQTIVYGMPVVNQELSDKTSNHLWDTCV